MSELTVSEWAWLAGILEGEASFHMFQKQYPRIILGMTDEDVITKIANFFGCKIIKRIDKRSSDYKPCYQISITHRKKVSSIITNIFPYMSKRRRDQIQLFINQYQSANYDVLLPDTSVAKI